MSDYFAEIERELRAATARRAHMPWYRRTGMLRLSRGRGRGHGRVLLIAVALLLASTAIALAATGTILTGSPVKEIGHQSAGVGDGVPIKGTGRLLPLRAADPAGGLTWGMRIVHTTRGLVCVQIGRVYQGRLGELGIDGAFGDDGKFHPLPENALPDVMEPTAIGDSDCQLPKQTYAGYLAGIVASAAHDPLRGRRGSASGAVALSERRDISFGLLGKHARRITYRTSSGLHSTDVLRPLGAYLIVQRARDDRNLGSISDTFGDDVRFPFSDPVPPNGALRSVRYLFPGRECVNTGHNQVRKACGLSEFPPPHAAPASVHEPIRAHLTLSGRTITKAEISFPAPYAVTSAGEGYSVSGVGCGRYLDSISNADVARGATVHIPLRDVLIQACGHSLTLTVEYERTVDDLPVSAKVGTVTVRIPRGMRIERETARAPEE
jgi:hypothetical protein